METGEIRADIDCDAIAAEIIAMMDGLQVQWLLNPDEVDLATVFAHYIGGMRDAITARSVGVRTPGMGDTGKRIGGSHRVHDPRPRERLVDDG
jgi:hypothetical protein